MIYNLTLIVATLIFIPISVKLLKRIGQMNIDIESIYERYYYTRQVENEIFSDLKSLCNFEVMKEIHSYIDIDEVSSDLRLKIFTDISFIDDTLFPVFYFNAKINRMIRIESFLKCGPEQSFSQRLEPHFSNSFKYDIDNYSVILNTHKKLIALSPDGINIYFFDQN